MASTAERTKTLGRPLGICVLLIFAHRLLIPVCRAGQTITASPTQNLQSLVNTYPAGTTFSLSPGIYRLQTVVPQNYDSFVGQTGAVLSGAALLTSFRQSGANWTSHAQVAQASSYPGVCNSSSPACAYPEDLFFDNAPKARVTSLSLVGPGNWFLDYSTGTVYMGDNPSGHTVEISLVQYAFTGASTNVTISNLTIEKYACLAGNGALDGSESTYWAIGGNQIQFNHGAGIRTGNGIYIYNNSIDNNGQLGIGGGGAGILVQSNQIYSNNYSGYSYYWEAGGVKISSAQNVTYRYNFSHNNGGPVFWLDVDCQQVICEGNQSTGNMEAGIFSEFGNNVSIFNNYVWNDGFNPDGTGIRWGAGILTTDSTYVSVYFNSVSNCMNGIGAILAQRGNSPNGMPYILQNVDVNSNTITQNTGLAAGIVLEGSGYDNSVYTSWNNVFKYNNYTLTNPNGLYFYWMDQQLTFNDFNSMIYGS